MDKTIKYFLFSLAIIILTGIIMVYSSSYIYSKEVIGSSTHFLFKQLQFLVIGSVVGLILSRTKLSFWHKHIYKLHLMATAVLALTFTPLGSTIKGSHRWIDFGPINLQPGEFVKYSVLFTALKYFNNFSLYEQRDKLIYLVCLLSPLLLFVLQPDFGTFSISVIFIMFACFMSNFNRKYFAALIALSVTGLFAIMLIAPYRVKRVLTYLNPWADPQNSGFQIIQSYLAFANGHIFGAGIGNSNEKLFYLPEAYNDFIFSVIGEELGFIGVIFLIALFISFIFFGFKIAVKIEEKFNALFAVSVIFAIGIQACLNMAVVLGLLPTKGLNLPFVSYGGSSIIANLMMIGLFFAADKRLQNNVDNFEPFVNPITNLNSNNDFKFQNLERKSMSINNDSFGDQE